MVYFGRLASAALEIAEDSDSDQTRGTEEEKVSGEGGRDREVKSCFVVRCDQVAVKNHLFVWQARTCRPEHTLWPLS